MEQNKKPDLSTAIHKIVLNEADFNRVVEEINNPKPPTPALIKARQKYLDLRREDIRDQMDEHMVNTSSAKRL